MNEVKVILVKEGDKKSEKTAKEVEKAIEESEEESESFFKLVEEKYPENEPKKGQKG